MNEGNEKETETAAEKPAEVSHEHRVANNMKRLQTVTLLVILAAVIVSLAFDSGLGTPSSFGIGQFFLLCPLGGIEAMIASGSFLPVGFIALLLLLIFALVFGRAWCSWGCPAPRIRRFFKRDPKPAKHEACAGEGSKGCQGWSLLASLRHIARDKRSWALLAVIVATIVAGIPLFCLICPVGLTFGTVGSLWHLIVDKQMTWSAAVFPAALVVELIICRVWCLSLCPIAGLLNIVGQFAVGFRPKVKSSTCLMTSEGKECSACLAACPEQIDLHAKDTVQQLGTCQRCGACARTCPTSSISFKVRPQLKSGDDEAA